MLEKVKYIQQKSVKFLQLPGPKFSSCIVSFFTKSNLSTFCFRLFFFLLQKEFAYHLLESDLLNFKLRLTLYFDSFWIFMLSKQVNPGGNHSYLVIMSCTRWRNLHMLDSVCKYPQMENTSIILACSWNSSICVVVFLQ